MVRKPTSGAVTTRRSTAPIATVNRSIWIAEEKLSQVRSSLIAATMARTIVASERPIAVRTITGRAWELVRATIEVALVAIVRTTAGQPWLASTEVRT